MERRPEPSDRRGTLIRLTRRGKATIDKAVETHTRNEDVLLHSLTAADRRILDDLLRKLLPDSNGVDRADRLAVAVSVQSRGWGL